MRSSKFVGPAAAVPYLAELPASKSLGRQHFSTVYFDDQDDRCYADQFRKSARRFKVRLRSVDGLTVLEVKLKGGRGERLRTLPAAGLDANGIDFIRECLDSAFEPSFARGVEQRLRPVVETEFERELWGSDAGHRLSADTEVVLRVGGREARLLHDLALIELTASVDPLAIAQWLQAHGFSAVGFSKFGAALDLLRSERVRSHKPGLLPRLFEIS